MTAGSQQQSVGEGGIGVLIGGDGNTVIVYAGSVELCLTRKHLRRAEPKTELQFLRVDLRATTLIGRERDLGALEAWLASDRLITVRCVTGRAGVGKTRLAIELCEQAEKAGWSAGFAQYEQFPEFIKQAARWRWSKPTLVVIDYAAALASELRTWLNILARPEARAGGNKLRLLLLERHAERDFGWWADLTRTVSFSDPAPDELADPLEPVPLLSLNAVEERRILLAEAIRLAGQIARIHPIPEPPPPGADADFDRRLGDHTISNEPLYLMMAGAEAIRTGAAAALALTRTDLAKRAANREREKLKRLATQWGLPDQLVGHLAMCVTLQGGCSAEEALQLITEERGTMGFPETGFPEDLVDRLAEALPISSGAAVDAVQPDLIGEAFLLQGMQQHRRFPKLQTEIVKRAWRRAGGKVATTLIRTAQDYAGGDANHRSVLWLRFLADQTDDVRGLAMLAGEFPKETLALRELATEVQERISRALSEEAKGKPELRPLLASSRNNLAIRLNYLGRREEALAAALEATELYCELAIQRPEAFRLHLAGSLITLTSMLSALGRREAAQLAAEKAVALCREPTARRPDAFRPELAMSLNNLSIVLGALSRREEALAAALEATELYCELAGQRADAFRPHLAASLHNLAIRLSDLGRREAALKKAAKATALYRELAAQWPDAFRPDLAMSLNNLSNTLSDLGRREAALTAAKEAVGIRRELVAQRSSAFRSDLAGSLTTLANALSDFGRPEAAVAAAEEGVVLYRGLAEQQPDAFRPDLAVSLAVQANCLDAMDLAADAIETNIKAIATLHPAFAEHPAAFGHLMNPLVRQYCERCRRLEQDPDMEMLSPILAILQDNQIRGREQSQ